jgi:hypothetical protein
MDMIDSERYVKEAICQYLNENSQGDYSAMEPENIVSLRIFEDNIVVLIDCGIKGTPRFTVPADKLEFNPKPVSKVKFADAHSESEISETGKPKPVKRPANGRRKRGAKK